MSVSLDQLKAHLAPNQEVILLGVCDGTCRPLLSDEDLKAALANSSTRFEVREVMRPQSTQRGFDFPWTARAQEVPKDGAAGSRGSTAPLKRRGRYKVAFGRTEFAEPLDSPSGQAHEMPVTENMEEEFNEDDPFDVPEETTNLVEAMGLQKEYRSLRSQLRKQVDFVWKTLQEHREAVSLVSPSPLRTPADSRMKVHGRDLAKLRRTVALMEELKDSADESLLQKPVEARWWIPHARQRLSQENFSAGCFERKPRRRCWESSWQTLGPFASLALRLYACGDGDAMEGNSVIFFWMETKPIFSFSFTLCVGNQHVTTEHWASEAAWTRVELPWALIDFELTELENVTCPPAARRHALPIQLRLVQWQGT